ncbi:MAG: CAP domain-containing protein [Anaerolineae bacterium]|nr:CAP domain-containing protein [Anaerolineae bacterium]
MKNNIKPCFLVAIALLLLSCNLPVSNIRPALLDGVVTAGSTAAVIASTTTPMNITIPPPPLEEANVITPTIVSSGEVASLTDIIDYDDTVEMLTLVNQARCQQGLLPVTSNSLLKGAATQHSLDMLSNSFFDHKGIDGGTVGERVAAQGYVWLAVGENLAAGSTSAEETFGLWWESPGHKANLLNPDFREADLSHLFRAGSQLGHYWTLVLANQGTTPPTCGEMGF